MYAWVVIGGGVQGCCTATRLLEKKVSREELLIIDPHPQPMHVWRTLTDKTGMSYLRSPSVHHLAEDPYSLKKYSRSQDYTTPFKGKYSRPRLDMFNQHTFDEMKKAGVQDCWKQGWVHGLTKTDKGWRIGVSGETIEAERVVLAMGVNHVPHDPLWSKEMSGHPSVSHLFDFNRSLPAQGEVIIVGGGMTAAHTATTLAASKMIKQVTVVKRHPFRVHDFDSDPGWLGPKYLNGYRKVNCYIERRRIIQEARHKGSITRELRVKLQRQVKAGKLKICTGDILRAETDDNRIQLSMSNQTVVIGDSLVLATGAHSGLPGKEWLKPAIDTLDLPCAPCGFPIVQPNLEWSQGLFVAGALAELEIGPVSRNIAGARKAAERITASA
ncbi:FAD/NAD(P)-binding protein [Halobacillus yeomjeoni]|uniref:FAD/NAD(P)-binding protein n=1 Tax=Halobacillus yeomjeoni TaxID=311194 RepID=A0A931HTG0_9BACI|nr:FAD/NAD(P)-binding protein [Halobacillus yeomjeoni]MBH0229088.1 FAD/NAD(P)-binding protein [Halobacillus yeomjeoni]